MRGNSQYYNDISNIVMFYGKEVIAGRLPERCEEAKPTGHILCTMEFRQELFDTSPGISIPGIVRNL